MDDDPTEREDATLDDVAELDDACLLVDENVAVLDDAWLDDGVTVLDDEVSVLDDACTLDDDTTVLDEEAATLDTCTLDEDVIALDEDVTVLDEEEEDAIEFDDELVCPLKDCCTLDDEDIAVLDEETCTLDECTLDDEVVFSLKDCCTLDDCPLDDACELDDSIFILCNKDALGNFFDNTSASGRADTLSVTITTSKKQIKVFLIILFLIPTTTYLLYVSTIIEYSVLYISVYLESTGSIYSTIYSTIIRNDLISQVTISHDFLTTW